ncbi:MAG: hypothetical protein RLZ61_2308 [Planctomycetota bacterium]
MQSLTSENLPTYTRPSLLLIILVACVLTVLNAIKPVHMDDNVYIAYGVEFIAHPLNPYDFNFGSPNFISANQLLVPPVLPYYLGTGIALLGDNPILFKLWLFPFALLLSGSFYYLFKRFAPGYETNLLWFTVLSPAILPGFNCMLEIPVLALGLTALVLAFESIEKSSISLTILSGLILGLAIETKYTALITLATIFWLYLINRRIFQGIAVVFVALLVFISWEVFIHLSQGQSHFIIHLGQRKGNFIRRCLHLILPLLTQVGGIATIIALMGLLACKVAPRIIIITAALIFLGFASLALVPADFLTLKDPQSGRTWITLSTVIYGLMAILVWGTLGTVVFKLLVTNLTIDNQHHLIDERKLDWFLCTWLMLELMGYFALSPFPAVRRVIGITLVFTFIAARLLSKTQALKESSQHLIQLIICFGISLGVLFYSVDFLDAQASKKIAHDIKHREWGLTKDNTHWHLTWWGLSYYADKQGLKQLAINQTIPNKGDIISVHNIEELVKDLKMHKELDLELLETVNVGDGFPLRTTSNYYSGRTPMEHNQGPRVSILVYKVR